MLALIEKPAAGQLSNQNNQINYIKFKRNLLKDLSKFLR